MEYVTLFRPVDVHELTLIEKSGWKEFPPRLPGQPIFYPVTNLEYASQIAREWNTKFGDGRGYVTQFDVRREYLVQFEKKIVGAAIHEEFWIPAERLDEFNSNIVGTIDVIAEFVSTDA